jgi:hypothetical protein
MLMAEGVETPQGNQVSRIVLVSRGGQSYVSTLQLPDHDIALRFVVPAEMALK